MLYIKSPVRKSRKLLVLISFARITLITFGLLLFLPFAVQEGFAGKELVPSRVKGGGKLTRQVARYHADAVLMKDLLAGEVIMDIRSDRRRPPASLTKIMSALVIIKSGKLHERVTITREAARTRKVRLRVREGDVFYLKDLLKAMLIKSSNDVCTAAAIHVGGSVDDFVDGMNQLVALFRLQNTHFANPCGFDAPEQYSTAHDLATLAEIALGNPVFQSIVSTTSTTITSLKYQREYVLRNSNRLLHYFPGVQGVKTGFTSQAGRCLIVSVRHKGKELLLVLLHARPRWRTATKLINYGLRVSKRIPDPAPSPILSSIASR